MRYVWDPEKNKADIKKHDVSFEDAVEVFLDEYRIEEIDDRLEYSEERLIVIGMAQTDVLFVVAVEKDDELMRIISARDATKAEKHRYDQARLDAQK